MPINAKQTGLHHACDGSDRTVTATPAAPISKASVPGRLVQAVKDLKEPGDFLFLNSPEIPEKRYLLCILPGDVGFARLPLFPGNHAHWELSGSQDKPTLSPSILSGGVTEWHGYLRDGVFVSC